MRPIWVKSSQSSQNGGQCVEVARNLPGRVLVRDSKNPEEGALAVPPAAWAAFLGAIKAERFS